MGQAILCISVFAFLFLGIIAIMGIRIVAEYERGVVLRLGRLVGAKGPGLFFIIPGVDRMQVVDTRTVTLDVPPQDCITLDNVTVRVNAVAYYRVIDPNKAVVQVRNYNAATMQISQTTLRSVVGQVELDRLLSDRDEINRNLQTIIDEQTDPWGIKVSIVELKDVELPESMKRSMARQAEAEREKRAKIIHASGEFEAATQLVEAADLMANSPGALTLRYLQTLTEIAAEKNSTIIFPLPIDLISALTNAANTNGTKDSPGKRTNPPFDVQE